MTTSKSSVIVTLALLSTLLAPGSTLHAAERAALIIGNNTYAQAPLDNAIADATAVRGLLRDQLGFPESGIVFGRDLKRLDVFEKVEAFKKLAAGADIVLVYYAGHGMESLDGKENFLIPVDADITRAAGSEAALRASGINILTIMNDIAEVSNGAKVVLMDCCRERPTARGVNRAGGGLITYADDQIPADTLMILAAAPRQLASDGENHGPFTLALLETLPKPEQSLLDAFFAVSDRVQALTEKQQVPWMKFDGSGKIFREQAFLQRGQPVNVAAVERPVMPARPKPVTVPPVTPPPAAAGSSAAMEGARAGEVRVFGGIEFVWCPPGEFLMGSPESEADRSNDEKQHRVTLTRGFWMAKTECTQGQYSAVMGENPSNFKGSDDLPVETVSWDDAQEYSQQLGTRLQLPAGWKVGLPTEAQWEYACRAGTTTPFSFGRTLNGEEANCDGNYPYGTTVKGPYLEQTAKVGSYPANAWGLVDMHGNVWEWCQDWYGEDYYADGQRDPTGPVSGSGRVSRGGGWGDFAGTCRSAYRDWDLPGLRHYYLGFRVVVSSSQ